MKIKVDNEIRRGNSVMVEPGEYEILRRFDDTRFLVVINKNWNQKRILTLIRNNELDILWDSNT